MLFPYVHRCRSKQIFGVAKDFCPNFHKNLSCDFCLQIFFHKNHFFGVTSNKISSFVFLQTLGATYWSQTTLSTIFAQIFRDFQQIETFGGALAPLPPSPPNVPLICFDERLLFNERLKKFLFKFRLKVLLCFLRFKPLAQVQCIAGFFTVPQSLRVPACVIASLTFIHVRVLTACANVAGIARLHPSPRKCSLV